MTFAREPSTTKPAASRKSTSSRPRASRSARAHVDLGARDLDAEGHGGARVHAAGEAGARRRGVFGEMPRRAEQPRFRGARRPGPCLEADDARAGAEGGGSEHLERQRALGPIERAVAEGRSVTDQSLDDARRPARRSTVPERRAVTPGPGRDVLVQGHEAAGAPGLREREVAHAMD